MRLGILGSPDSPYVKALLRAAADVRDVEAAECVGFSELAAELRGGRERTSVSHFEAVLVRTMPLGSLEQVIFRMDCLQLLEAAGTLVVNPPKALEVAIDKWLTLHRLRLENIATPDTIACQTRDEAIQAFQELGGDCIVKPLFGGEGRGMLRVQDVEMAWRVFSTLQQLRSVIYVQQFEANFGYDIRVLFIGDSHFVMRRMAAEGNWMSNVAQGSLGVAHELTAEQLEVARRAAKAVGGPLLGVDLLPCRDGSLKVLEVNAVPGWKELERVVGQDLARIMVEFVAECVRDKANARV